jgi:hypothetical protein
LMSKRRPRCRVLRLSQITDRELPLVRINIAALGGVLQKVAQEDAAFAVGYPRISRACSPRTGLGGLSRDEW